MTADRAHIAWIIASRLQASESDLTREYVAQGYFLLDDLLPEPLATGIHASFPDPSKMMLRKSLREAKYVTSQMNQCAPIVEEAVYAFQDPRVVEAVARITGLEGVEPDAQLYAGGISLMGQGHYLRPHLDNSHDMQRERYRVLNLLYYTTPDWKLEDGGNLELWPHGTKARPLTIHSRFNRLLVIATHRASWHSVSPVLAPRSRTCVSNYYFSKVSPEKEDYFHVTSFHGRPEEPVRDLLLRADGAARNLVRKIAPAGVARTKHYYKKDG